MTFSDLPLATVRSNNVRFKQMKHQSISSLSGLGFGDRLLSELKKLAPKDIKIRVSVWNQWGLVWFYHWFRIIMMML